MSDQLPVMICGYKGRMGQTLLSLAESENAVVKAQKDQGDDLGGGLEDVRVAIDFSFHTATADLAEACAANGVALVIGTTGHTEEERARILACTDRIPVVWAGNYSIGVNLLFHLTESAARVLGDRYQAEVMEIHHQHKKDAPSGTAVNLAEAIEAAPAFKQDRRVHGREGDTGARTNDEIGMHALRGGEVIGEHTVFFFGENDRIELTHRASDRRIFASGAYRAAHWATNQKPGLYNMRDVLGLGAPGESAV
ncbi:MAG: 4-hydroxy-tetrahydrodipicolinate reductase [Puniceicoccaceae bacterium]